MHQMSLRNNVHSCIADLLGSLPCLEPQDLPPIPLKLFKMPTTAPCYLCRLVDNHSLHLRSRHHAWTRGIQSWKPWEAWFLAGWEGVLIYSLIKFDLWWLSRQKKGLCRNISSLRRRSSWDSESELFPSLTSAWHRIIVVICVNHRIHTRLCSCEIASFWHRLSNPTSPKYRVLLSNFHHKVSYKCVN